MELEPRSKESSIQLPYLSVLDILLLAVGNLKIFFYTFLIFISFALFYIYYLFTPVYLSTATFVSSNASTANSNKSGLAIALGVDIPVNNASAKWSYQEVIKSRSMAKTLLYKEYDFKKNQKPMSLLNILNPDNDSKLLIDNDELIHSGINTVQNMIDITLTRNTYRLTVEAFDAVFAADLANSVIAELNKHQQNYNSNNAKKTRQFIESLMLDSKSDLEAFEESLKDFRQNNRNINESPQLQLEQDRLLRDVLVATEVYSTLKQQLETAKIDEVRQSEYVIILDSPEVARHPFKPKKRLVLFLVTIFSFFTSIIYIFGKYYIINSNSEKKIKLKNIKNIFYQNIKNVLLFR